MLSNSWNPCVNLLSPENEKEQWEKGALSVGTHKAGLKMLLPTQPATEPQTQAPNLTTS